MSRRKKKRKKEQRLLDIARSLAGCRAMSRYSLSSPAKLTHSDLKPRQSLLMQNALSRAVKRRRYNGGEERAKTRAPERPRLKTAAKAKSVATQPLCPVKSHHKNRGEASSAFNYVVVVISISDASALFLFLETANGEHKVRHLSAFQIERASKEWTFSKLSDGTLQKFQCIIIMISSRPLSSAHCCRQNSMSKRPSRTANPVLS